MMLPPGVNSQLKDKSPEKKAETYEKFRGLLGSVAVAEQIKKSRWNEKAVKKRAEEILEWARKEWKN
jgi:hypothetical protein